MKTIPKNGRLLIASLVVMIIVYLRESTWSHLSSPAFWIVAFLLLLSTLVLGIMLVIDIFRYIIQKERNVVGFLLHSLTFCILLLAIFEMK